ncbi:MAG: hypothetical protein ABL888_17910 [Pirellulaceae bacterium]
MRTKFYFVVVVVVVTSAGCQSLKLPTPKMPSFSNWYENRPRLFAKKEKESLAPPPKHFEDPKSEAQIARNETLEIDAKGTPKMPSQTLEPYTGNPKKSPMVAQDGFQTPKVGGFDESKNPGSREPYQFKPKSNDDLKNAAENLANNWNDAGKNQNLGLAEKSPLKTTPSSTNNSDNNFSPPSTSTAKSNPNSDSGFELQPRGPIAKEVPGALAQQLSPSKNQNLPLSPSLGANQSGSDTLPKVLTPNMPSSDSGTFQTNPKVAGPTTYPRTPQAENTYEKLAPIATAPIAPKGDSFANSPMKKIPNQFVNEPLTPKNPGDNALAVKPSVDSFPSTKNQQYTVQPTDPTDIGHELNTPAVPMADSIPSKSVATPGPRTATLPESLKVKQGYKPGSTGRVSTF